MTTPDETPGRVAATLAEIEERARLAKAWGLMKPVVVAESQLDVSSLLAAVEAALKHHQRIGRHPDLNPVCGCSRLTWPCPEVAAITAALTGTPENDSAPTSAVREDEGP